MLDTPSLKAIEEAVRRAEASTSGEIVVVIADRSASWAGHRMGFACVVTSLATLGMLAAAPELDAAWWVLAVPVVFFAGLAAASLPFVLRLIVPASDVDDAVLRSAKVAFVDRGVHRTRDRAGVLIYLSRLEHRVQILGDVSAHERVGDEGWKQWAARIVTAMKEQRAGGVVDVISDIGSRLAVSFPRSADDVDELPNAVVVSRS